MHSVAYYRISDGVVVGSTTSQNPPNIDVELPYWGQGISALRVDDAQVRTGKIRKVVNGALVHEDDPDYIDKKSKKKKVLDKIQAKLNLTDQEFSLIWGG